MWTVPFTKDKPNQKAHTHSNIYPGKSLNNRTEPIPSKTEPSTLAQI